MGNANFVIEVVTDGFSNDGLDRPAIGWFAGPKFSEPPTHGHTYENGPEMQRRMLEDLTRFLEQQLGGE